MHQDLDGAIAADDDRPVGQRVRAHRHQRDHGQRRVQDRPAGGQRVGGGAGGRGDDQAVGAQVVDELPVDAHLELDQAALGALGDRHVVEREHVEHALAARAAPAAASSMRASVTYWPSSIAPDGVEHVSIEMSVRKPSRPWLTPTSATSKGASVRAMLSMVPSPPMTMARSARRRSARAAALRGDGRCDVRGGERIEQTSHAAPLEEVGELEQRPRDLRALVFADQRDGLESRSSCSALKHTCGARGRRSPQPDPAAATSVRGAPLSRLPLNVYRIERHAERTRTHPAEDAGRALHRRRPAGRLARAVASSPGSTCRRRASATSWRTSRRWASSRARTPRPAASRRRAATASSSTPCSRSSRSTQVEINQLEGQLQADNTQHLVTSASHLLSDLTRFAGVVMTPRAAQPAFRHIEFLKLSDKRILLIIVTPDGDVQNRILLTDQTYTAVRADRGRQLPQPELRRAALRGDPQAAAATS